MESPDDNPGEVMGEDTAVIETVTFYVADARHVLSHIKPEKSPVPDGIPGLIHKEVAIELSVPLSFSVRDFHENRGLAFAVEDGQHRTVI
ncbi:unnamed protein product [Dibothriocephalus latus]|uniref:Uncharacterized protein n=1 Tax=Dibothriocephalus latus TaxID=60516 RepID=A0A3P7PC79_DIBLA|nr:unnamed protein product [Dibothriocephalus latus]